jgi:hypothetical protein
MHSARYRRALSWWFIIGYRPDLAYLLLSELPPVLIAAHTSP